MLDANTLVNIMKDCTEKRQKPSRVLYGTVVSVDPLRIRVDGIEEPLNHKYFYLPWGMHTQSMRIPVRFTGTLTTTGTTNAIFNGFIESEWIWPVLREGDKVLLTSYNKNQRYIVHSIVNRRPEP